MELIIWCCSLSSTLWVIGPGRGRDLRREYPGGDTTRDPLARGVPAPWARSSIAAPISLRSRPALGCRADCPLARPSSLRLYVSPVLSLSDTATELPVATVSEGSCEIDTGGIGDRRSTKVQVGLPLVSRALGGPLFHARASYILADSVRSGEVFCSVVTHVQ